MFIFTFIKCHFVFFSIAELCTEKHGWYRNNYHENLRLSPSDVKDTVERVDARTLTREDFIERYERPFKPVVLTHAQDDWLAQHKWTIDVRNFSPKAFDKREYLVIIS